MRAALFVLISRMKRAFFSCLRYLLEEVIDGKKRIVVKIGSSSLTNTQGEIDQNKFYRSYPGSGSFKESRT